MDAVANFAYSTVATAPSPATSGTSLVVAAGQGTRFPAVPFNAAIWPFGAIPTPANSEIVRVTARSTDTLTITRTQESTSARSVIVGDQIAAAITAKTLTDLAGTDPTSFSPTLTAASGSGAAYTTQVGRYIKRDKEVFIAGQLILSSKGTLSGGLSISGLPFPVESVAGSFTGTLQIAYFSSLTTSLVSLGGIFINGASRVDLYGATGAATALAQITAADFSATTNIVFSGRYITT